MKVIFLDHQWTMYLKQHPNIGKLDFFDKEAINVLNEIIEKTNAEIVVSSDWKLWVKLEEMKQFYLKQNIKEPISYTKYFNNGVNAEKRANEINIWLEEHKEVTNWVAIDDLDMRSYLTNFAWIYEKEQGIKQKGIKEIILSFLC